MNKHNEIRVVAESPVHGPIILDALTKNRQALFIMCTASFLFGILVGIWLILPVPRTKNRIDGSLIRATDAPISNIQLPTIGGTAMDEK